MKKKLYSLFTLVLIVAMLLGALPGAAAAAGVPTEQQAYNAMIAMKSQYPEGMHWTNANYASFNGGIYSGGYGCAGFAFMLSDAAFGTLPARYRTGATIDSIHVGDILRINNDTHSVIVLEVHPTYIVIAEGNYNSSIHWGRTLPAAAVASADYCLTRYPVGTFHPACTLTIDANGGTIYDGGYWVSSISGEVEQGESFVITDDAAERTGYELLGFSTSRTATTPQYKVGDTYTISGNATLYAVWKYAVTTLKGSSVSIPGSKSYYYYEYTPSMTGDYTFASKSTDANTDPYIYIWDPDDPDYILDGSDDISGDNYNFSLTTKLTAGKTYLIEVGFFNPGAITMTITGGKLATPKLSYIGTSVKGIELKWNAVPGAENYGVWYKTATGAWTKAGNTTDTQYVVSGLTSGTTYTFTVRCLSADGKTYMSGFDATGKTFMYLETPKLSYIGTSVKGVEVKWNAVKNAENYGVWYKTATGAWTKAGTTTGTEMVVSGLTSGTTYTFTVRCLSADGKTYTSGFDATGKTFMYLETPKLNYIGTSVKGVEVKWNPVKNAVNYGIWYKTATGSWTKAGTTTGNQFVVSGLTSGTTYTFTVRCLSADGKTYMSGFDAVGKQFTYLTTPTVSSAEINDQGVKVAWEKVTGAYGYRVFYKTATGSWTKAADVTGDSYTVTGLKEGVSYTFTVRCIGADGSYTSGFDAAGKTLTYVKPAPVEPETPDVPDAPEAWGDAKEGYVWVSKTGSKYHYWSTCSSMSNPSEISLEEAVASGLEPCGKCVN